MSALAMQIGLTASGMSVPRGHVELALALFEFLQLRAQVETQ